MKGSTEVGSGEKKGQDGVASRGDGVKAMATNASEVGD